MQATQTKLGPGSWHAVRGVQTLALRRTLWLGWVMAAAMLPVALTSAQQDSPQSSPPDPLDGAFAALATHDWGPSLDALAPIDVAIAMSHGNVDARRYLEDRLLGVLQSDAPRAAKDFVCRKLSVIGTDRSVDALGTLLDDPDLGQIVRGALETIPGERATQVLGAALPRLKGPARIGAIHSLGRRADPLAAPILVSQLQSGAPEVDEQVQSAILSALSHLDAPAATSAVLAFDPSGSAVLRQGLIEASLRIAHRSLDQGDLAGAADVFHRWEGEASEPVQCAVLVGLIEAEPATAAPRLLQALAADNERLRRFAAQYVREHAVVGLMQQLVADLPQLPLSGQIGLLEALSDQNLPEVRGAALAGLQAADPRMRATGARALAVSGQADDVPQLVQHVVEDEPEVRGAACEALEKLPGADIDAAIVKCVEDGTPQQQIALVPIVAARQIRDADPMLFQLVGAADESVRLAAYSALETMADARFATGLAEKLAATSPGSEREAAQRALWRSCLQIEDSEERGAPILGKLQGATTQEQAALLPALGLLGGTAARKVVDAALVSDHELVRDAAVRALSNWPDASVADELMEIARTAEQPSHRIWALRGFARVVGREAKEKPQETFLGLRDALALATRLEDKQLILSRLTAVRTPDALALALSLREDESVQREAIEAVASLAEGMKDSYPKESRAALEQIVKLTPDPELQLYITKLLWNMQLKGN